MGYMKTDLNARMMNVTTINTIVLIYKEIHCNRNVVNVVKFEESSLIFEETL